MHQLLFDNLRERVMLKLDFTTQKNLSETVDGARLNLPRVVLVKEGEDERLQYEALQLNFLLSPVQRWQDVLAETTCRLTDILQYFLRGIILNLLCQLSENFRQIRH